MTNVYLRLDGLGRVWFHPLLDTEFWTAMRNTHGMSLFRMLQAANDPA